MIKLNTIKDALDNVNIFDIPYDIGVFKTERLVQQAISPILDRWPLVYQRTVKDIRRCTSNSIRFS